MPYPDNEHASPLPPFHSHTALLIATALPFLQPPYRYPAELVMKFLELSETLKFYRELPSSGVTPQPASSTEETGIFSMISRFIQDPEGLLRCLLGVCTGKEKEIVSLLLNLLQAKSFYENYGDILNSFMPSEGSSMPDMASVFTGGDLSSMLNNDQNDTLNLLKNLLDAE